MNCSTTVSTVRPFLTMLAGALVSLLSIGRARAQMPEMPIAAEARWPTTSEDEQERLGRFLDAEEADERRQSWTTAVGGLAVGVPQIALEVVT